MSKSGWTKPPTMFSVTVDKGVKEKACTVMLSIHRNLLMRTPVDTGRARANWLPSAEFPNDGFRPANYPPALSLQEAEKYFNAENYKNEPLPVLYISNNLPYIQVLNEGHSDQAPEFFVEIAIMDVIT